MDVLMVAGARPNFMKIAPVMRVLRADPEGFAARWVHTGQHYDPALSATFLDELEIPPPEANLGVGSGGHAIQTAQILTAFDAHLEQRRPDLVMVVGDVNSTLACGLAAVKRHVPVAHIEAGLRSRDRRMPEEINRVLTDALSDLLFVTEDSGLEHLRAEGLADRAHLVGNVMIDTLLAQRARADAESRVFERIPVRRGAYVLVTLHRPENVDHAEPLGEIAAALLDLAVDRDVVFAVHPRTEARLRAFGLRETLGAAERIHLSEPLPYRDFVAMMGGAGLILSDSGGIQEEAAVLSVPCLTIRGSTERPSTLGMRSHRLVGKERIAIRDAARELLASGFRAGDVPSLWDGRAAERIVKVLRNRRDFIRSGGTFGEARRRLHGRER